MTRKIVSITLNDEIIKEIQELAKKNRCSFSNMVEKILAEYLEAQKK